MRATILVVDDSDDSRREIGAMLQQAGYAVLEARPDGGDPAAAAERPDLIVLHLGASDETAPAVYRRLRTAPTTALVPILQLSPDARGTRTEADASLATPVTTDQLAATVEALLDAHWRDAVRKAAFDVTLDAIVTVDDTGTLLDVNEAGHVMLRLARSELVGRRLGDFVDGRVDFGRERTGRREWKWQLGETRLVLPDGLVREVEYVARANVVPGRSLVIFRDITRWKRREAAAKALFELAHLMSETLDVNQVARRITESARSLLGVEFAGLYRIDRESEDLVAIAVVGPPILEEGFVFPRGVGVVGAAVRERRPIVTPNLLRDPRIVLTPEIRARLEPSPRRAVLAVPLMLGSTVIGALAAADAFGRVFDEEAIRIASAFADQAALAFEKARLSDEQARLLEETQRQREEAVALEAVARNITASLQQDVVLRRIVHEARALCKCDVASLASYDPAVDIATICAASGERSRTLLSTRIARGRGIGGRVLETGEAFTTEDYVNDPRISKDYVDVALAEGTVAQAVVPIRVSGEIIGLLSAANRSAKRFSVEEVRILERLADQAAIAMKNSRLYAERIKAESELRARARQDAAVALLRQRALAEVPSATLHDEAVALLAGTLEVEYGAMLEFLPEGDSLRLKAGVGWRDGSIGQTVAAAATTLLAGPGLASDKPLAVEDIGEEWGAAAPRFLRDHGVVSALSVVIHGQIPPFGVLAAFTTRRRTFSHDEAAFVREVASVLEMAIPRENAMTALSQHAARLNVLRETDRAILAAETPRDLAREALRHLRRVVSGLRASVTLFDFEAGEASILALDTASPTALGEGTRIPLGLFGDLEELAARRVRVVSDFSAIAESSPHVRTLMAEGVRAWVQVPLVTRGDLIGTLNVMSDTLDALSGPQLDVALEVAESVAVGLAQARLHEEVEAARDRLRVLSRRLVDVQEAERRRLARELHDEVGQILTALKLTLERAPQASARERRRRGPGAGASGRDDSLAAARAIVGDLITQVRDLSLELRPSILDDLGLVPALLWHVERYTKQTKIHVDFAHKGVEGRRFPQEIETAVYRIVQEGLTNIARHASVGSASVRLWEDRHRLNVQIEDTGAGFDAGQTSRAGGAGFTGMRERILLLGGRLEVETAPGAGVRVTAELPAEPR